MRRWILLALAVAGVSLTGCSSISNAIGRAVGNEFAKTVAAADAKADKAQSMLKDAETRYSESLKNAEVKWLAWAKDKETKLAEFEKKANDLPALAKKEAGALIANTVPGMIASALKPIQDKLDDGAGGTNFPLVAVVAFLALGLIAGVVLTITVNKTIGMYVFGGSAVVAFVIAVNHYRKDILWGIAILGVILIFGGLVYWIITKVKALKQVVAGAEAFKTAVGDVAVPLAMVPVALQDDLSPADILGDPPTVKLSRLYGLVQNTQQDASTVEAVSALRAKLSPVSK